MVADSLVLITTYWCTYAPMRIQHALQERPSLTCDGSPRQGDANEDPEVAEVLCAIRSVVLKDRLLHDKVCDAKFCMNAVQ